MDVEVSVLMEPQALWNAFLIATILDRLHRDRSVLKLSGPLVGKDAVREHRGEIRDRHDAMQFGDACVHTLIAFATMSQASSVDPCRWVCKVAVRRRRRSIG